MLSGLFRLESMSIVSSQGCHGDHIQSAISASIPLLSVTGLTIRSRKSEKTPPLVNKVSFRLDSGKTLALTGESGSGKTLTSLALLGLLPKTLHQATGKISFKGNVLSHRGPHRFSQVRGAGIAMIFQEPLAALNPVLRVGYQIEDVVRTHRKLTSREAKEYVLQLLNQVDLSDPGRVYEAYPHQLSGGMAQRVTIAMALSCNPELIIADEPTTALDAVTQKKILCLISKLQQAHKFALLLISHDVVVVAQMADSRIEMAGGQIVVTSLPL